MATASDSRNELGNLNIALLHGGAESVQVNPNGILYVVIGEFSDEVSLMETRLHSPKARTSFEIEPFIEPAVSLEEMMVQLHKSSRKWKKEEVRQLEVNDLVWIVDENEKRAYYKMGRVLEVYHERDGRVRSALVKTDDRKLKRLVVKLAHIFHDIVFGRKTGPGMLATVNCEIRNSNWNMTDVTYNSKNLENLSKV